MQLGGGRVKCDFNYLNFPLLVYLRGLSTSLKFSRSSAQLMWLSCWLFTFNCQHSCTSCLGDKFILIDIEINKSYFKLVQLWWTHNLSDLSLSHGAAPEELDTERTERLTERNERLRIALIWPDFWPMNWRNFWKLQKVPSELKTNDGLVFFLGGS